MKNIFQIFKEKLEQQTFSNQEKSWSQFEARLNKEKPQRKIAFWFRNPMLIAGSVLLGLSSAFFLLSKKETAPVSVVNPVVLQPALSGKTGAGVKNLQQQLVSGNYTKPEASQKQDIMANALNHQTKAANTGEPSVYVSNPNTAVSTSNIEKHTTSVGGTTSQTATPVTGIINPDFSSTITDASSETTSWSHIMAQRYKEAGAFSAMPNKKPEGLESDSDYHTLQPGSGTKSAKSLYANPLFSLSVFGGASQAWGRSNLIDENAVAAFNRRKKEESTLVSPSAGIETEIKFGHWTLTTGLNVNKQGEKRKYSNTFIRDLAFDSVTFVVSDNSYWNIDTSILSLIHYNNVIIQQDTDITYYDENDNSYHNVPVMQNINQTTIEDTTYHYIIDSSFVAIIDTAFTHSPVNRKINVTDDQQPLIGKNQYTYVEVPLLLGYEKGIKRFRVSVKTGIGLGRLVTQKTYYLAANQSEVKSFGSASYSKWVWNHILRLGLHFYVNRNLSYDISLFSRTNLNDINKGDMYFRQRYINAGIQSGFTYRLK